MTITKHPHVLPLGYSEAAMFLRSSEAGRVVAIISIHGTNECGVESTVSPRLDLNFDDAASPDSTDMIASYHARMRLQALAADGRLMRPPTISDAKAIIQFAHDIKDLEGILLCHCSGGVSRATAAALLCLATWAGPGLEGACVEEIFRQRTIASPHPDLIRFGDALLGRNGQLMQTLRAHMSPGELQ